MTHGSHITYCLKHILTKLLLTSRLILKFRVQGIKLRTGCTKNINKISVICYTWNYEPTSARRTTLANLTGLLVEVFDAYSIAGDTSIK